MLEGKQPTGRSSETSSAEERLLRDFLENRASAPWGEALEAFWKAIASTIIKVLRRYGPADPNDVDDLIQDVYLRLCADDYRLLRQTRADRPAQLVAFVQAIAMKTTLDRYRLTARQRRGGELNFISIDSSVAASSDPATSEQISRDVLISQIDRQLQNQSERDRRIFWLYYRHGFTASEIAAISGLELTTKGVESAIYRLTSEIRRFFSEDAPNMKGEKA